ncbi:MAG: MBL fold metallo-hydrolase [Cytophagales bacterium]|nr:MAG: MBL fold metallo-hydrolase [Cytophagales bacterium]
MFLTIWGAAKQVTGSMHLLELANGYKILIDCGADFSNQSFKQDYDPIPFDASQINLVVLTHAHLDHSGNIPLLVQRGFKGNILSTAATLDLSKLLLSDYASINKTKLLSNPKVKKSAALVNALIDAGMYLEKQVDEALTHFISVEYNKLYQVTDFLKLTLYNAGHLLGAAMVVLEVEENGKRKKIGFSGDIGRNNYPLLEDPAIMPEVDVLICETTYGNRVHTATSSPQEEIDKIIYETCIKKSGRLIIPAFSIGRTQTLLYVLNKLNFKSKFGKIKVFADSPLAREGTKIYQKYIASLNSEAKESYQEKGNIFDFDNLIDIFNFKDSKAISNYAQPCVIVSSSGMITGGRIQHHIQKNINNPYCTILTIGYSAEGTPGAQIVPDTNSIRLAGKDIPVAARIVKTDVFSGHADKNDLINFVGMQNKATLEKVFLVHGEEESMLHFQTTLHEIGYRNIIIPEKGQAWEL